MVLFSGAVQAQSGHDVGVLEGTVYREGAQGPARLARVVLLELKQDGGADQRRSLPGAVTTLNGTFSLSDVPVGDYYVYALLPGYLDASRLLPEHVDTDAVLSLPPSLAKIHVADGRVSQVRLVLSRGAVLTGQVTYDDGSPVQGAAINVLKGSDDRGIRSKTPAVVPPLPEFLFDAVGNTTDDSGRFRIAGLEEGSYSLRVTLSSPRHFSYTHGLTNVEDSGHELTLAVYLGDKLHWREASTVHVGPGEERSDLNIHVNPEELHLISGMVQSASNLQRVVTGSVALKAVGDPSFVRRARIQDGAFEFDLLPAGGYTIDVDDARDVDEQKVSFGSQQLNQRTVLRRYENKRVQVEIVGNDLPDLVISLKLLN